MSQSDFGNLSSPLSGESFINDKLEPWRDALHSTHSGSSRPSYVTVGMQWLDTTTTPWILKLYDGADDITQGTFNSSTNIFTPSGAGAIAFTGNNTHSGTETFSNAAGVTTNTITERTAAAGITADGVLLKDSKVTATGGLQIGADTMAAFANAASFSATLTGTANVTSVSDVYSQCAVIGNLAIVWGRVTVTATAAAGTATTIDMNLPVASALTDNAQVSGFFWMTNRDAINGGITGNASNDKATFSFLSQSTSARTLVYGFCYPILT
jgi:hypothetical protein